MSPPTSGSPSRTRAGGWIRPTRRRSRTRWTTAVPRWPWYWSTIRRGTRSPRSGASAAWCSRRPDRGQFADLHTKTDALCFALATLTTVGYGDVHPVGQAGRAVVIVQLAFNVAVITTGVSVLSREVSDRIRERSSARLPH